MPTWVQHSVDEYSCRFPKVWRFGIQEVAQANASTPELTMKQECTNLLATVSEKSQVVVLDNQGSSWSSVQLAEQLERWQTLGKPLSFIVGGAAGLHQCCRTRADQLWSLSALTFPHPLVRVIVVEQLYRAHTLLINHPYHRA